MKLISAFLALMVLTVGASAQNAAPNYPAMGGASSSSPTTPGGATSQVQYNNNGAFAADSGLTYVSASTTLMANFYGLNNNLTSSNTEVLYTSGTVMDGAHGLSYDRVNNRVFIGTPTGVSVPAPSATLHVSGTIWSSGIISNTGMNVTGVVTATSISGPLTTAAQPSITSVGTLTALTVTGNSIFSTISATTISASTSIRAEVMGSSQMGNLVISGADSNATQHLIDVVGNNSRWQQFPIATLSYALRLTQNGSIMMQNSSGISSLSANVASSTVGIGAGFTSVIIPSSTLHVSGTILGNGSVTFTGLSTGTASSNICITTAGLLVSTTTLSGCLGVSDPRVKTDIQPLRAGIMEIMAVDAITYRDMREGAFPGPQIGVLAYGVARGGKYFNGMEEAIPELVDQHASTWHGQNIKAVIYERLTVVVLKALQQVVVWNLVLTLWLLVLTVLFLKRRNRQ